jgi:hypothetical protein
VIVEGWVIIITVTTVGWWWRITIISEFANTLPPPVLVEASDEGVSKVDEHPGNSYSGVEADKSLGDKKTCPDSRKDWRNSPHVNDSCREILPQRHVEGEERDPKSESEEQEL